jgi:hypothetical protein
VGSSKLPLGNPGTKCHLDVAPMESYRVNPDEGGRGAQPRQSLEKFKKYRGGEEAPPNGGAILPKDVQITPFRLKGLINYSKWRGP